MKHPGCLCEYCLEELSSDHHSWCWTKRFGTVWWCIRTYLHCWIWWHILFQRWCICSGTYFPGRTVRIHEQIMNDDDCKYWLQLRADDASWLWYYGGYLVRFGQHIIAAHVYQYFPEQAKVMRCYIVWHCVDCGPRNIFPFKVRQNFSQKVLLCESANTRTSWRGLLPKFHQ